ncbi:MAG: hypothetical protein M3O70_26975 [Actinomycetota bacterium]|nr:hypothetical protein [Actinomycetota bacterium]
MVPSCLAAAILLAAAGDATPLNPRRRTERLRLHVKVEGLPPTGVASGERTGQALVLADYRLATDSGGGPRLGNSADRGPSGSRKRAGTYLPALGDTAFTDR